MSRTEVVVVDYGAGNIRSVCRGLESVGSTPLVTNEPEVIRSAGKIILPGVGAFPKAMEQLKALNIDVALRDAVSSGSELLGICLGMQLLFDISEEFGRSNGLGFMPGKVVKIPSKSGAGQLRRVPHIGWNEIYPRKPRVEWVGTGLQDIEIGSAVYFVHSFMAQPELATDCIAECLVDGLAVAIAVEHENVLGYQFHPEKSGLTGLKILENFVSK
jgi:glutamine amidotransferase